MRYVLANWKMYVGRDQAAELLQSVQAGLAERFPAASEPPRLIACPPFTALAPLSALVDRRLVHLGAQNCHWETEGPHTGEVSPRMLAELVDYVLIGHSERRALGETDAQIAKKVAAAAEAGLTPILFVGEDEPTDTATDEAERRLDRGLAEVDVERRHVLVVYEPTWAIGSDRPADSEHVRGVVERLKDRLAELGAGRPEVVYGGTVNVDNVEQFTGIDVLDGVGATRGSLEPSDLMRIVDRVASA
ncbi:MAG: triose-phosphate isomerase [Actinomycetota bacterium]|nr:triose-phosphate isomerase [Actinomycetota bacterium]